MQSDADGTVQVAVVGAGAAGLGAASELRRRGLEVVLLDRGEAVGDSWRARYEGLRLNSAASDSRVGGVPVAPAAGRFPSREAYAEYLEGCARRLGLDVRLGVEVRRIDRAGDGWALETSVGELRARAVVVATGYDREPALPAWPGRESFAGELIHAAEYRSAAGFAGRSVLVVGTGNSGTEISAQLAGAGAARVWVAMRTPVNIMPREFLGLPSSTMAVVTRRAPAVVVDVLARGVQRAAWGDLARHGMPRAPYGVGTELRRKGLGPVIDGAFVAALKARRLSVVAAVERFESADVVLADGTRVRPDAVIAATGYRHGLEPLVGHLGVLEGAGRPRRVDGRADPAAPGLHFNGFWQPLPGQLPGMRVTSRRIGREVARQLGRARAPVPPGAVPRRRSPAPVPPSPVSRRRSAAAACRGREAVAS